MLVVKKRAEAVELRLQGWQFQQIAEALKCSTPRAYQLVQEGLDDILTEPVEKLRAVEIARCDAMLTGVFPAATQGDHAAIASVLAVTSRRDRLLGIMGPEQVEHRHKVEGGIAVNGQIKHTMELVFVEPSHEEPKTIEHVNGHAVNGNGHDNGSEP